MRLEDLSDGELEALSGDQPDYAKFTAAAAARHGVRPELALAVMHQESGGNPGATSPKGAHGPMQLMPGTARDLGVDSADPVQNIDGGLRYLKQQIDTHHGDERLGLAAYNAGPGAVAQHGGVPPYPETQAYVSKVLAAAPDLSGVSDEELARLAGDAGPSSAPAAIQAPPKPAAPVSAPRRPPPMPGARPTIAQDAASGFMQPFRNLGHDVMQGLRTGDVNGGAGRPTSLAGFGKQVLDNFTAGPRMIGDVLGLASAPVQAVVRPTARALNNNIPLTPHTGGGPVIQGGKLTWQHGHNMAPDEAQAALENALNTALSAAQPANASARLPKVQPRSLEELKAAKDAAYAMVDSSGVTFKAQDLKAVAKSVTQTVADEGGKELYPKAAAMAKRIGDVAAKGDISLTQLDKLRAQVGEKLMSGSDQEARLGGMIRDHIDALIDSASHPAMREARAANTQYMKAREVTNRVDSADLRASSTYAGGNQANATRQNLRPLIDPKSAQRMRNATPDEVRAIRRVVSGTPTQNAVRLAGKTLDPRGLLGATVQTLMGLPSHGLSTASVPLGMAATEAGKLMTNQSVQQLLDLISTGGVKPGPRPYVPMPVSRLASPAGLTGVGVATAPLVRLPARKERAKTTR